MLKKKFKAVLMFCMCLFLIYGSVVFASAESFKSYDTLYNEEEYSKVLSAIEQFDASQDIPQKFYAESYDADTAKYKIYKLSQPDMVVQLNNGKSVSDCLSTEYSWTVEAPGKLFVVVEEQGEWRVAGYQYLEDEQSKAGIIDTAVLERNDIALNKSAQDAEILFFEAPLYFTNFVYYTSNETEYLIPYGSRPDLTLLENGKVYTAKEVADILTESFNLNELNDPNGNGGGAGAYIAEESTTDDALNNSAKNSTALKIVIPVVAVIAIAVILIIIVKRRKR